MNVIHAHCGVQFRCTLEVVRQYFALRAGPFWLCGSRFYRLLYLTTPFARELVELCIVS